MRSMVEGACRKSTAQGRGVDAAPNELPSPAPSGALRAPPPPQAGEEPIEPRKRLPPPCGSDWSDRNAGFGPRQPSGLWLSSCEVTSRKEGTMPRISEIEEPGGDPVLTQIFEREREAFGDLLNPTKIMAHCPPILRAAKMLGASIDQSGQLPKALLSLVNFRVASINGCPF